MNPYTEAQRAILSIIMNYGEEAFAECDAYVKYEHFTKNSYKYIWKSTKWLYDHGHAITDITIKHSLQAQRDVNGQVLFDLIDPERGCHEAELAAIKEFRKDETISHLPSYIDIILDKYTVDRYMDMAQELITMGSRGRTTAGQLQAVVQKHSPYFSAPDRKQPRTLINAADTMIEKNKHAEGDDTIIHTDMPQLDKFIWLTPGNQTVIGGDTGHGKTSFALQIAWNVAKQTKRVIDLDTGKPVLDDAGNEIRTKRRVLFFSLEMSEAELLTKLCCIENNISVQQFMIDTNAEERVRMLTEFRAALEKVAPYFMVDYSISTISEIEAKTNMVHSIYGSVDLVVVDYLQLVSDVQQGVQRGREDEVYRAVSRRLKKLAMTLDTHTIALSQLNKPAPDKNGQVNHRPTLDRLFGSSAMKQDASQVIFVYREWSVNIPLTSMKEESFSTYFVTRIIVAKNRFGYNNVEILCGFIPYLTYFIPLNTVRLAGLQNSRDTTYRFPHIGEFLEDRQQPPAKEVVNDEEQQQH